jgi:hypothetical protein
MVRQVSEVEVNTVVHKSCALAVQTFMLAMSEKGYDTCPLEGFDSYLVKKALHLPCHCQINMVITCGIRLPEGVRGERFRLPFEEMYHKETEPMNYNTQTLDSGLRVIHLPSSSPVAYCGTRSRPARAARSPVRKDWPISAST